MLTHLYNFPSQLADNLAPLMGLSPLQNMLQAAKQILRGKQIGNTQ